MKPRLSTEAAAAISGFAILLPVGIRGAVFALCPAWVAGRRRSFAEAACIGFLVDLVYNLSFAALGLEWDPRFGFNSTLADSFPPMHNVVTHGGCSVPNSVQFIGGLSGWAGCFFVLWVALWPRSLPRRAYFIVPIAGTILVAIAGRLLWATASLREWPFPGSSPEPVPLSWFVFLLITSIPACTFCVGLILRKLENETKPAPAVDVEERHG